MKKCFFMFMVLFMIPFFSLGEGNSICPACGNEGAGQFCSQCGARLSTEEGVLNLTNGISRAVSKFDYMLADSLAERYNIQEYSDMPLYIPQAAQPMNAYLIIEQDCEVGINHDGIYPITEPDKLKRISSLLQEWVKEIENESLGAIRFVNNPDEADLLISACQKFPFYGYYGYQKEVRVHSCEVSLKACQLSNTSHTARLSMKNIPPQKISVGLGSTKHWRNPPELKDSKELTAFVNTILSWYGYMLPEDHDALVVQYALKARNAYSGLMNAEDSDALRYVIRLFQKQYGLNPTGQSDKATTIALYYDKETVRNTSSKYSKLLSLSDTSFTRVCSSCGWIYSTNESCKYCYHCGTELQTVYVGGTVQFGKYEQDNNLDNGAETIEWIVLEIKDGKVLLLSKYGLDAKPYSDEKGVSWKTCSLRSWLNHEFLNTAFTPEEAAEIIKTRVHNGNSQGFVKKWEANAKADTGDSTLDKIYLLSPNEAFDKCHLDDSYMRCIPTDYAIAKGAYTSEESENEIDGKATGTWWSRLTANNNSWAICMSLGYNDFNATHVLVRPALWVNLESGSF